VPIGSSSVYARTMAALEHNRARVGSVLDLGIGMGLNGAGVRQWLDYGVRQADGRWRTRLVGIEGWEAYRNPVWDVYDAVEVGRIEDSALLTPNTWDCVLFTDVIEHMPMPLGRYILGRIAASLTPNGFAIVGTPAVFWAQGAAHGNDLERHVSAWRPDDFRECGWQVAWDGTPDQYGQRMLLATWGVTA
jgi:2-polyprenyl-3-methyl-5-hydroxy-6-metoxy-1,4-benzoquinol methylase